MSGDAVLHFSNPVGPKHRRKRAVTLAATVVLAAPILLGTHSRADACVNSLVHDKGSERYEAYLSDALERYEKHSDGHESKLAIELLLDLVNQTEREFGKGHPNLVVFLEELVGALDSAGAHAEADMRVLQVSAIYESVCGDSFGDFFEWSYAAAQSRRRIGASETALILYGKSLSALRNDQPLDSNRVGRLLYEIGVYRLELDQPKQAKELFEDVFAIVENEIGKDDDRYAGTLYGVAERYLRAEAYHQAEELYLRILRLLRDSSEANAHRIAQTLDALGRLYVDKGRLDLAADAFTQALESAKAATPLDADAVRIAERNLAYFRTYEARAVADKDETALREALSKLVSEKGILHHDSLVIRRKLATHLRAKGKDDAAASLYRDLLPQMIENTAISDDRDGYRAFLLRQETRRK